MSDERSAAINPMAIVRRGLELSPEFKPVIALLVGSGVLLVRPPPARGPVVLVRRLRPGHVIAEDLTDPDVLHEAHQVRADLEDLLDMTDRVDLLEVGTARSGISAKDHSTFVLEADHQRRGRASAGR